MTFKYINVTGTAPTVIKKSIFSVIEDNWNGSGFDLIVPLNGYSEDDAGQKYLYTNKAKQGVYVRKFLPQTKYQTFEDELHGKNPRKQLELFQKEESERIANQKLELLLKGY